MLRGRRRSAAGALATLLSAGCVSFDFHGFAEGLGETIQAFLVATECDLERFVPSDFERVDAGLSTRQIETAPFDRAVVSWNGRIPAGDEELLELRALVGDDWTPWFAMVRVRGDGVSSVPAPPDPSGRVVVDTLELFRPARALQIRVTPAKAPAFTSIGVTTWTCGVAETRLAVSAAWPAKVLPVAERSQQSERPEIAPRICSPTAVAMALEFLGKSVSTAEIAKRVHDAASDAYGNWTANASVAGSLVGEAFVVPCSGFYPLQAEIAAGRPVVIRLVFGKGELEGAPIEETEGHLVLVVGFTEWGDVVVNDPAAQPTTVRRTYSRGEFDNAWLRRGEGVAYVFRPSGSFFLPREEQVKVRELCRSASRSPTP